MRCDFCGDEIESNPYQKDGINFCSLECCDAMDTGESIPLGEEALDNPDEFDEDYEEGEYDQGGEDDSSDDEYLEGKLFDVSDREDV